MAFQRATRVCFSALTSPRTPISRLTRIVLDLVLKHGRGRHSYNNRSLDPELASLLTESEYIEPELDGDKVCHITTIKFTLCGHTRRRVWLCSNIHGEEEDCPGPTETVHILHGLCPTCAPDCAERDGVLPGEDEEQKVDDLF